MIEIYLIISMILFIILVCMQENSLMPIIVFIISPFYSLWILIYELYFYIRFTRKRKKKKTSN